MTFSNILFELLDDFKMGVIARGNLRYCAGREGALDHDVDESARSLVYWLSAKPYVVTLRQSGVTA